MEETARVDRSTIIHEALDEVAATLSRAPDCSDVRALRAKAEKLLRSVEKWSLVRPDHDQLAAMHEVVSQLQESAQKWARHSSGIEIRPEHASEIESTQDRPTVRAVRVARPR